MGEGRRKCKDQVMSMDLPKVGITSMKPLVNLNCSVFSLLTVLSLGNIL